MTDQGIDLFKKSGADGAHVVDKSRCQEAIEAFETATTLKPMRNTVQKQFALLMNGQVGEKAKKEIDTEFTRLGEVEGLLRGASEARTNFQVPMAECDQKWREAGL